MKIFLVLFLMFSIPAVNVFSQTANPDSSFTNTVTSKSENTKSVKTFKKISAGKTSSKETGILIGAAIGAGAGALFGVWAGSFSLEPSNDKKASFGDIVVCAMVGAAVGGIVGGLVSK